jgi:hypothetical protein
MLLFIVANCSLIPNMEVSSNSNRYRSSKETNWENLKISWIFYLFWPGGQSWPSSIQTKISLVVWYIHRSGILHGASKNILLGVKKVKISFSARKRNLGPKICLFCDISIDREFYMNQEKIYFWGSKRRK